MGSLELRSGAGEESSYERVTRNMLDHLASQMLPLQLVEPGVALPVGVISIGGDICETREMEESLEAVPTLPNAFLDEQERAYCGDDVERITAHFALKEAVFKTVERVSGGTWQEIHIRHNEHRAPYVTVTGNVAKRAQDLGIVGYRVSMSHSPSAAMAVCVALGSI